MSIQLGIIFNDIYSSYQQIKNNRTKSLCCIYRKFSRVRHFRDHLRFNLIPVLVNLNVLLSDHLLHLKNS